jgi:hypothetical protein
MSFATESVALTAAFWLVSGTIAIYLALAGAVLALSVPRQYRVERAPWEPARRALFLSLPATGVALAVMTAVIVARHIAVSNPVVGVICIGLLVLNTAIATATYVRTYSARGAGLFAFVSFAGSAMWIYVFLEISSIMLTLWGKHSLQFSNSVITVFGAIALLTLSMTLSSLSAAHRRLSGVLLGSVAALGIIVSVDPGGFLGVIELVAGLR